MRQFRDEQHLPMRTAANTTSADAFATPSQQAGVTSRLRLLAANKDARRGVTALADQAVVSGLGFVTSLIIANASGRAALGIAHLALTLVYFMINVQGELVSAPYTVFRGRKHGANLHAYSGSMFFHQFVLGIVAIAAIGVTLLLSSAGVFLPNLTASLWVLLVVAPVCLLHAFIRNVSFAALRFGVALAMDATVATLQLGGLLILAWTNVLTVPLVFVMMGISSGVGCIGWFVSRPEPLRFVRSRFAPHWRENWLFARWAMASHVVGCAGIYILPVLVALVHDETMTGTYVGCAKLSALAATFVVGISHVLTPRAATAFVDGGKKSLKRVLWIAANLYLLTVGGFCLVVWMAGDYLMAPLFGPEYAGTGHITTTLSLAVLTTSIAVVTSCGLWAINRPQANLFSDVVSLAVTLTVACLLVTSHGAFGIALATLAGGASGAVCRLATLVILMKNTVETETL